MGEIIEEYGALILGVISAGVILALIPLLCINHNVDVSNVVSLIRENVIAAIGGGLL